MTDRMLTVMFCICFGPMALIAVALISNGNGNIIAGTAIILAMISIIMIARGRLPSFIVDMSGSKG